MTTYSGMGWKSRSVERKSGRVPDFQFPRLRRANLTINQSGSTWQDGGDNTTAQ